MGRVDNRVAFITGAARGQGRSHAIRLAEEGADIIAVDVCAPVETTVYDMSSPEDLLETVRMVRALGRRIIGRQVDIRDYTALAEVAEEGAIELGRLDIVSSNAGISTIAGSSLDVSPAEWQAMIDVNLTGQWNTIRATVPHILAGGAGGSVIITSSSAGLRGYRNIAHYVAAKHALVGMMRTLANEYGKDGIRFNTVHPTNVDTPLLLNDQMFRLFCPGLDSPGEADFVPAAREMHLLPVPWVNPVDVSNAVLFLASDEARYITGVALPIDAGAVIKT